VGGSSRGNRLKPTSSMASMEIPSVNTENVFRVYLRRFLPLFWGNPNFGATLNANNVKTEPVSAKMCVKRL
jgi:hypothetical protein